MLNVWLEITKTSHKKEKIHSKREREGEQSKQTGGGH